MQKMEVEQEGPFEECGQAHVGTCAPYPPRACGVVLAALASSDLVEESAAYGGRAAHTSLTLVEGPSPCAPARSFGIEGPFAAEPVEMVGRKPKELAVPNSIELEAPQEGSGSGTRH